jgi:glutamyl-Q tRNA(Asp) synthetase
LLTLPTFRFAPGPNGRLHLGHAYSALLNGALAKANGGRMLLRIEDIDTTRCTPAFEAGIHEDLHWLGVEWEGEVRRQSEHFTDYEQALSRLIKEELVYPAFMSRGEIRAFIAASEGGDRKWPRDPDGVPLYPALDKALSPKERRKRIADGMPFAWRLDVEAAVARIGQSLTWKEYSNEALSEIRVVDAQPQAWGDVILARREIPTSYHLSVVVDDALQGISHVVRGMDLYFATGIQRLLQELLGLPQPHYFHHRLVLGPDGRKLSKSQQDTGIADLRQAGATPAEAKRLAGFNSSGAPVPP